MKKCPRCDRTYPHAETFCEADGSALAAAGPAFVERGGGAARPSEEGRIECPVCGGTAEPGEVICNFCGARLTGEEAASAPAPQPTAPFAPREAVTRVHREPAGVPPADEGPRKRGLLGVLGYLAAAVIALLGGTWLALHLSSEDAGPQVAVKPSPSAAASPAPAVSGPLVALANALPVQVTGSGSPTPERSVAAARKLFKDHQGELLAAYNRALAGDSKAADAMLVRLRVLPDGTVSRAAVRTSTASNPSLDADVVKSMLGWNFAPSSGGSVDADYPIIFAHDSTEAAKIESGLQTRLASLSSAEPAEYALIPAPAVTAVPTPAVTAVPAPVATPVASPVSSSAAALAPAPALKSRPRPARRVAPAKPAPALLDLVRERLKSDRRLNRVNAYTAGGTVTLYGRVFDGKDKLLAERVVRGITGVSKVVDTLTTDTAQWAEAQDRITRQLQDAGLGKVTVKVIGHDAYLDGAVKTELEKQRAVTITEGAAPVTVRENLIRVEPGSLFGF